MIHKQYNSFEDIEQDLRILKLQRQIDEEKLKLSFENTKKELYPVNILGGMAPLLQKIAISLVAKKVLQKISWTWPDSKRKAPISEPFYFIKGRVLFSPVFLVLLFHGFPNLVTCRKRGHHVV